MSRRYVNNWPTAAELLDRAIAELDERATRRIPQALALARCRSPEQIDTHP